VTEPVETTIGDIATSVLGGPFGSSLGRKDYVEEGVPVIRGAQLSGEGRFSLDDLVFVTEGKADRHSGNLAFPGDLVVTQRGTLGQVGIIPYDSPFKRYLLSQSQMKITVDPARADASFIYYLLLSPAGQHRLTSGVLSAGVPHINLTMLRELRISIPDLRTQQSVAHLLTVIDDLIDNNRRRVALLEEMAREIYKEWFVRFRYPGHESVPLVDSPLGPIPQGWGAVRLSDLVSTQYGYTESATTEPIGPKYLRGMDINKRSYIDWSKVPFCPIAENEFEQFAVRRGDVFVIRMADPGKVGFCEEDVDAVFASYLVRMRPTTTNLTPLFLFFALSDTEYQNWVTGASTGATRKSVSARVMTEYSMVLPPPRVQAAFEDAVGPMRTELGTLVRNNATLTGIRDLLLPKLVTGQIDVTSLRLDVVT
jgi:type I restriction enzyme S subunit